MLSFFSAFFVSVVISLMILLAARRWVGLGLDLDLHGIQKMHRHPVPRVGGFAIFAAVNLSATLIWAFRNPVDGQLILRLLACALPAFLGGLAEDFTRRVKPLVRLLGMGLSCLIAYAGVGLVIPRVDVPGIDHLVALAPVGLLLTLLAMLTITNAINIIDGLNGLAAVVSMIILIAIGFVGWKVGDWFVLSTSLMLAGAIAGFLVWNYPLGKLFLGDGGAYFLGFMLGALAILLVARNQVVSAWFPVLVLAYPLVEVAFSVYRRKVLRGRAAGLPDAAHLHQLLYKRIVRWATHDRTDRRTRANAMTAPYLWLLSSMAVVPAALFYDDTPLLAACFAIFCIGYIWLYFRIVMLRSPAWLSFYRKTARGRSDAPAEPADIAPR